MNEQLIIEANIDHNIHAFMDEYDNRELRNNIMYWDHVNPNQVKRWLEDIAIECNNHHITLTDIGLSFDKMYDCISKDFYDLIMVHETHKDVYNPCRM